MLLVATIVVLSFIWVLERGREGEVRVTFCDVGQGDGAIIRQGDWEMLIDVGADNGEMLRCLSRELPFWDKKIELIVLTHEDADHIGALGSVGKYYEVEKIMGVEGGSEQINYTGYLRSFDVIRYGKIDFEILWPEKGVEVGEVENEESLVGILRVEGESILFTGDAPVEVEQYLVWREILNEKVTYLKVSHHGSKTGTSEELLEVIEPEVAIVSVGKNSYGHPSEEVISRLSNKKIDIWKTENMGDIKLTLGKGKNIP